MTKPAIANNESPFTRTLSGHVPKAQQMLFGIAGRVFVIDCEDQWSAEAISRLFAGWFLRQMDPDDSRADATIRIRCGKIPPAIPAGLESFDLADGGVCHTKGNAVYIRLDDSLIVIPSTTSPDIDVWIRRHYDFSSFILAQIISQAFCAAMRRCGLYLLHSAGVLPPRRHKALLIIGASGSGKSTLTFQLAASGWGYFSDDSMFLRETPHGIKAQGLRKFFALKDDTIAAVQLDASSTKVGGANLKKRLAPEDFFPEGLIETAGVGGLVFPVITDAPASRLKRLTPFEAMSRMLKLSPWACYDKPTAPSYLKFLGKVAAQASAFDLFAGRDLLGDPIVASNVISQTLSHP